MQPGQFLNVHFDNTQRRSGWRCVIVLSIGRRWTRLLYPPTCEVISILNGSATKFEPLSIRNKRELAKRIRDRAEGIEVKLVQEAVKEAIALIRLG